MRDVAKRPDTNIPPVVRDWTGEHSTATGRPNSSFGPETGIAADAIQADANSAARIEELEQALRGLDNPIAWIAEHYPAAMREMPTGYLRAIERAGDVLARGREVRP